MTCIEGSSLSQTIEPSGGGRKTGTIDNLLINAPNNMVARDAQGRHYGIRQITFNDIQDSEVVRFLRERIDIGPRHTYPTDVPVPQARMTPISSYT